MQQLQVHKAVQTFICSGWKIQTMGLDEIHDSVAIIIHHIERRSLLFVRQFRPAIYFNRVYAGGEQEVPPVGTAIDGDPRLGLTVELCAGIVDKEKPLAEIAAEEVQEECGFNVSASDLERVSTFRTGVGTTGSMQTIFYAKVTEAMRLSKGGGNPAEGEYIETVEVPISQLYDFILDESIPKPTGCAFGVSWFLKEKLRPSFVEVMRQNYLQIAVVSSGITLFAMLTAVGICSLRK
ncbi:hypothetical protein EB796_020526 [Bugula neritina]|uniref:Uridine diphosphate glucose pyrophosphatase NUDT14 n=1 Tax=Bugula neritina TaxID=10212 RepID=A0A7J7J4Z8_BUGNE|nr:hypothetical protein EB796_020526 [Bugula neritina]